MTDPELEAALAPLLARRWLVVGSGNDMRGDDAFGPLLARRLRSRGLPALDAGMAPENFTGLIRRAAPEVLVLADAVDMEAPPGTLRLLRPFDLEAGGTSTHDPSLRTLHAYLTADGPLEFVVLGAQPATCELGAAMSEAVAGAVEAAAALLEKAESGNAPPPSP